MGWWDYPPGPIGWFARTVEGDWGDDCEGGGCEGGEIGAGPLPGGLYDNGLPGPNMCSACGYDDVVPGGDCSVCGGSGTGISKSG